MSYLREIMQKLSKSQEGTKLKTRKESQTRNFLIYRREDYLRKLEDCTPEMLQYEWTWLVEHTEALELCLTQPAMLQELGGDLHVETLLSESKDYQICLAEIFKKRMIVPQSRRLPVILSEHAWELSDLQIKRIWGIDLNPSP